MPQDKDRFLGTRAIYEIVLNVGSWNAVAIAVEGPFLVTLEKYSWSLAELSSISVRSVLVVAWPVRDTNPEPQHQLVGKSLHIQLHLHFGIVGSIGHVLVCQIADEVFP